jgi:hypothetical protein
MPDAPIATHREQRFDGKRVFELFPERINIRGSAIFSSDFETSIPLNILNPNPAHIRFRNKSFWSGLWMLLAASVIYTILVSAFHVPRVSESTGLMAVFGMSGLALMLATARKVEFITFSTTAGVPILDFARSGPDAHNLDSFIELLRTNITNANS